MKYTITIEFESDRELNSDELDNLETAIITQALEPADRNGESVEYSTSSVSINTREGEE